LGRSPGHGRPDSSAVEQEAVIEAVGTKGDGIARLAGGGAAFVPLSLPGERVRITGVADQAKLLEILEASPERVAPPCPHYGACGGCALQHWETKTYQRWKSDLVRTALAREGLETPLRSPFAVEPASRRRLALHARRSGAGAAILGFKERRSWSVTPIKTCAVADPRLVAALPSLAWFAAPFLEHPKSAPILHVTLTETGIAVDVTGVEAKHGGLSADARTLIAQRAGAMDLAQASLDSEILFQARPPLVRFGPAVVALPAGGFLQASTQAEAFMVDLACAALAGCDRIADLFCGAGAFTFPLARNASVMAADASPGAIAALAAGRAGAVGLKAIVAEARDLFRRPVRAAELKTIQGVLFDPPRSGALDQAREIGASKVETVVGVSCNPTTFARDAAVLTTAGFRLVEVTPVDQFLWSSHIELVGVFRR